MYRGRNIVVADAVSIQSTQVAGRLPDLLGAAYFLAITGLLVTEPSLVAALTKAHPYAMGFVKFAILATFGECLKNRLTAGQWIPSALPVRALIWGLFGVWITAAFPFMDGGMRTLAALHLWPAAPAAFWMSTWINLFAGFGFFMMFVHYWTDSMLVRGFHAPWHLLGWPETVRWGKVILISIVLFWIPAHTVTFLLPPVWRILFAAYLGIALGLILSFAARTR
jgi:hypothetical protein